MSLCFKSNKRFHLDKKIGRPESLTELKHICRNYVSKTVAVQLMASSCEENPISDIHVDPLEGG